MLQRFEQARTRTSFAGLRRVEMRGPGGPAKFKERVLRQGMNTRIEYPDGSPFAGQVVIETATQRFQAVPRLGEIRMLPPRRDLVDLMPQRRMGPMRVRLGDRLTIAGVPSIELRFLRPDGGVVQRVWVNPDRGAILKREAFDPFGRPVAQYEFESVRFDPAIGAGAFDPAKLPGRLVRPEEELTRLARQGGFRPARLGQRSGWSLYETRLSRGGERAILSQFYTDGLDVISLHMVKGQVEQGRLTRLAGPGLSLYSWQRGENTLVLVGPRRPEDLRALSQSVAD